MSTPANRISRKNKNKKKMSHIQMFSNEIHKSYSSNPITQFIFLLVFYIFFNPERETTPWHGRPTECEKQATLFSHVFFKRYPKIRPSKPTIITYINGMPPRLRLASRLKRSCRFISLDVSLRLWCRYESSKIFLYRIPLSSKWRIIGKIKQKWDKHAELDSRLDHED